MNNREQTKAPNTSPFFWKKARKRAPSGVLVIAPHSTRCAEKVKRFGRGWRTHGGLRSRSIRRRLTSAERFGHGRREDLVHFAFEAQRHVGILVMLGGA